jgi:hypothetical protein
MVFSSRGSIGKMSGYTDDSIMHHGVLKKREEFLQKPLTPDALLRRVREVLATL